MAHCNIAHLCSSLISNISQGATRNLDLLRTRGPESTLPRNQTNGEGVLNTTEALQIPTNTSTLSTKQHQYKTPSAQTNIMRILVPMRETSFGNKNLFGSRHTTGTAKK